METLRGTPRSYTPETVRASVAVVDSARCMVHHRVMSGTEPAIAYQHVSKSFARGQTKAVDDVSLAVAPGEFLAIVGGSGSGKTTLLRLANRLIVPDSGTVRVLDRDVQSLDLIQLRRSIGYVFQNGGLFPHMTVAQNIGITPRLSGEDPRKISTRVDELIDLVRLDRSHRDRLTQQMSGGQRQRVGVARALAASPKIVLMDEPFGALDPLTRDALGEDYKQLHRKLGLTTVMITHDMAEAVLLADRIAVMEKGHLRGQGTAAQLSRNDDEYVSQLLGTPRRQAERLQALLPKSTS